MRNALTTLATTAVSFAVLATGGVMVQAAMPAEAGTATPAHDYCRNEDGSGQHVCVWDAEHQGNGGGDSFIAINGGTDKARYVYVSHAKAHRLTH